MRSVSRRTFLERGALTAAGLVGLGSLNACGDDERRPRLVRREYGPLVEDPNGIIDLPRGFRYTILSNPDARLSNGEPVPAQPDGMAAFAGERGLTVLIRNHELSLDPSQSGRAPVPGRNPYDRDAPGGTTGIILDPDRRVRERFVSSSGTRDNCAGGATPWGTWLTCEENRDEGHGYVFEVIPDDPESGVSSQPIRGMGAFSHEAVAIDPRSGIVYLTEDPEGASEVPENVEDEGEDGGAFLFRYVPDDPGREPGALQAGGRLEVLTLEDGAGELNADRYDARQSFGVIWKPVGAEDPRGDAKETAGAVRFNRLEGAFFAGGALWFDDTEGGEERLGQLYRYLPGPNRLELFYEGSSSSEIENPDNLAVTPWGDLWFAEDQVEENGERGNRIVGVTPEGTLYPFARNRLGEFAGPTFAPDGQTFFVNIQEAGLTLAVWGSFAQRSAARQRQLALAAPPRLLGPRLPGELREAGDRNGLTRLEAAAHARLVGRLV